MLGLPSALRTLSIRISATSRRRRAAVLLASAFTALLATAPASALNSIYITKFAGTGTAGLPVAGPALSSNFHEPEGSAVDAHGDVYIADYENNAVEKITPSGRLSVIAGMPDAVPSFGAPTPGNATESHLHWPVAVAVDSADNVYIDDEANNEIEKVTPAGTLSIVAGGGTEHPSTTPQLATSVKMVRPRGVAVDASGNLYVSDHGNHVVEKITPGGMLTVVAGKYNESANEITPGPAIQSDLKYPTALTVDASGNLYICDDGQNTLLKVTPGGTISRLAGKNGEEGPPTLNGPALNSKLAQPNGVAVDASGNIFLADSYNHYVEEINSSGTLTAVAGNGGNGQPTYGAVATETSLPGPGGLSLDPNGVLYIVDFGAEAVERIGTAPPSAPQEVSATLSGGTLGVSFLPPSTSGTSPISGYEVSADGGATWHAVTTTAGTGERLSATIAGLGGSSYTALVRAVNSSAPGPAGSSSAAETATPTAPREVTATLSGGTLGVSFLPPSTSGTSPISGYEVSADGGATWRHVSTSTGAGERLTATVPGLGGSSYTVLVRAVNGSGASVASAAVSVSTPTTPGTSTSASPAATTAPAAAAATKTPTVCLSKRQVTLHWLMPQGVRTTGPITVTVNGRRYKTLPASARRVTVNLRGMAGPAGVKVQVHTRDGRGITLQTERALHVCATTPITPRTPPNLHLLPISSR